MPNSGFEGRYVDLDEPIEGKERLWLTKHLLERMAQRSVTEEDVLQTIRRGRGVPGKQPHGVKRKRWHKSATVSLDVVYTAEDGDAVIVITIVVKDKAELDRWQKRTRKRR